MLQVYILYKAPYIAVVGKRENKEVFLDVEEVKSPYMVGLREKDCKHFPRYGFYLKGLKKAIQLINNSSECMELNEDESICFIMSCINVINWFLKGKATEPYVNVFNSICEDLDEVMNPVSFLYNNMALMENRYCRELNVVKEEETETMGDFFKRMQESDS